MANNIVFISFSGGLDSSTLLYYMLEQGYIVQPVSFNYGQVNSVELTAKDLVLKEATLKYGSNIREPITVDISNIVVASQKATVAAQLNTDSDVSEFYFPSRNLLFTTLLLNYAETTQLLDTKNVFGLYYVALGLQKHSTYEDYWDSNKEFLNRVQKLNDLNPSNIEILAPFVDDLKEDVVKRALELEVPITKTWTCYNPVEVDKNIFKPCGVCDACIERFEAGKKHDLYRINDYTISTKSKKNESN